MKKAQKPKKEQIEGKVIGWREWVALPELGVAHIKAKVDTGARSSSLHAEEVEYFRRRGKDFVRFGINPIQRRATRAIHAEAELLEHRNVLSSSGKSSYRPVIVTDIVFMGECWPIELTLANRDQMGFRMLLGREAIRGHYLVNPGKSFYAGQPKKGKTKVNKK